MGTSMALRRWRALSVGLMTAFQVTAAAEAQSPTAKEIARRTLPSVVTIETFDAAGTPLSLGSGFIVGANGVVVTNFHVIDGAASANVTLASEDTYRVQGVAEFDVEMDFAILKVRAVDLPVLRMSNSDRIEPGEVVFALGAPKGLSGSVTVGNYSQMRRDPMWGQHRMMQHSAAISPGSSGGPLVLESGEVVGVNTGIRTDGNSLYFALPINYVRAAIDETDWTLNELGSIATAMTAVREKANQDRIRGIVNDNFVAYADPDGLYSALLPKGWRNQRTTWRDTDNVTHVLFMAYDPAAERADLNGWISDGVRIHIELPPQGRAWLQADRSPWTESRWRSALGGYATSNIESLTTLTVANVSTRRQTVVGTSAQISDAERNVTYTFHGPEARASVDFSMPVSKKAALDVVCLVFESSFRASWAR